MKEGALELGMDCIFMALMSIEAGDGITPDARPSGKIPPPPLSSSVLPLKPPGRLLPGRRGDPRTRDAVCLTR